MRGTSEQEVAAPTALASTKVVAPEQAIADAFAGQAKVYAQLAAMNRAEAEAMAAAIATNRSSQAAARRTMTATAPAGPNGTTASSTAIPTAAAKLEIDLRRNAAVADRLGGNAQRVANFHLARISNRSGAGGAR